MRTTQRFGAAVFVSAALVVSVAGSVLAQDVEGSIEISGSSTVEPISDLVREEFAFSNPNVTISVNGPGTTTGFDRFCNGETDISDASRPISGQEIENCAANGITPIELKVAIDGLAVIVSTQNDTIECLDFNDLYAIFGVESDDLTTWEDVAAFAAELGSQTSSWPSGDIAITAPGDESGTWGSFIEITLEDIQEARAEAGSEAAAGEPNTRQPGSIYVASPNDNVIIDGVGANPNGIGFVGYAFAINNFDRVRMIPIDGGDGQCTAPSEETVAANTYPIARDLLIYPELGRIDPAGESFNPALAPFVDFYLSEDGQAMVSLAGYVRITPEALSETQADWDAAKAAVGA
jgi:phosphate transport system substrate-binding protein